MKSFVKMLFLYDKRVYFSPIFIFVDIGYEINISPLRAKS